MTTVIRAGSTADFLALVPRLVGFAPTRSLVLVPFRDDRTRGALRVDLREPAGPDEAASMAGVLVGMLCKIPRVEAMAAIVYTDAALADARALPGEQLTRALAVQADACGLRLHDALCVGPDGWTSYLAHPRVVHGLATIRSDHDAFDGPVPTHDQHAGAELPAVDLAERERVGNALREITRAMTALFGPGAGSRADGPRIAPGALAAACRMDDVPLLYEEALAADPAQLDPYDAAALVWCLSRPVLRDVALMQWLADLPAGDATLEAQLRWSDGEPYPEHLAAPMWGEADSPDAERLARALALVRRLAAAAPRAARPGVLAAAAWLAWALGRSSHASAYAARAQEIEPDHGLAGIVRSMVDAGHLPEWVYRR